MVRLDDHRPRAEARTIGRMAEVAGALPGSRDDAATVMRALDRPGVTLAFATQLLVQDADAAGTPPALAPPALAAAAYRTSATRTVGFMGLLDPIDVRA
ncbi:MAG: hypothetical protein ACREER_00535 [Alphaproteobacteria bacterium]